MAAPPIPGNPSPGTTSSPGITTSGTSVTMSWSSSPGATYYEIGVRDTVTDSLVVDTTTTSTSYTKSGLVAGRTYRWNVAAVNISGSSNYTTGRYFTTPGLVPATPGVGVTHIHGGGTEFTIDQELVAPSGQGFRDYTGITFSHVSTGFLDSIFRYDGSFLDEGASVFLVMPNDHFSEANIQNGNFTELIVGNEYSFPGGDFFESRFFLGIRTPALGVDSEWFEPAYGWAEIQNFDGVFSLLDHAMAYSSNGIIVNTVDTIMSPPTLTIGDSSQDFGSTGGAHSFTTSSTTSWNWSDDASWITSSETTSQAGITFGYTVAANTSTSPRSGKITFTAGGITRTHSVTQSGINPPGDVGVTHIHGGGTQFTIDQELTAPQGQDFRDYTGFIFSNVSDGQFLYGGSFLDEGVSVFLVESNDHFSEANIQNGEFTELIYGNEYSFPDVFFFGIRTPALGVDAEWFEPVYGWAEIRNLGGGFSLLNHAVAYSSKGIIVNTLDSMWSNPKLTISDNSQDFVSTGGAHSFSILSNTSWSWSYDASWITSSESSSQVGNEPFSYSVGANSSIEGRSATITFTSGEITRTHVITQSGATPTLTLGESTLDFDQSGGSHSFTVASNTTWSWSDNATWLTSGEAGSQSGSQTFAFTILPNPAPRVREASIVFTGAGITQTFVIRQEGAGMSYYSWLKATIGPDITPEMAGYGLDDVLDGNESPNRLYYALGASLTNRVLGFGPQPLLSQEGEDCYPGIQFSRVIDPIDIRLEIQASADLRMWRNVTDQMIQVGPGIEEDDGLSESVVFRSPVKIGNVSSEFRYFRVLAGDPLVSDLPE